MTDSDICFQEAIQILERWLAMKAEEIGQAFIKHKQSYPDLDPQKDMERFVQNWIIGTVFQDKPRYPDSIIDLVVKIVGPYNGNMLTVTPYLTTKVLGYLERVDGTP